MAHITGGGITENVPRVLPESVKAVIEQSNWLRPRLFQWLQSEGNVVESEMHRVFNCGIGMVVIVASEHVQQAFCLLYTSSSFSLPKTLSRSTRPCSSVCDLLPPY